MTMHKIIRVLLAISIIVAIVVVIWYIFGNSPTTEQLLLTAVIPLYIYVFYTKEQFNEKWDKLNERVHATREELLKGLSEIKQAINKK